MSREIKFRGKRIDNNQIVFGCLVNNMWTYSELAQFEKGIKVCEIFTGEYGSDNWSDAIEEDNFIFSVYPESVGQYTGLKDKNGECVYEGDIIEFQNTEGQGLIKKVWFCEKMCSLMIGNLRWSTITESGFFQPSQLIFEIIGNIHENPELLNQPI